MKKNEIEAKFKRIEKEIERVDKILVVEDNSIFLNDALKFFSKIGIGAYYATNLVEAISILQKNNDVDGVLSDIFFPFSKTQEWEKNIAEKCYKTLELFLSCRGHKIYSYTRHIENWINDEAMHPTGIFLARLCMQNNMPCALITNQYHHDNGMEPIYRAATFLTDSCSPDKKEWEKGLVELKKSRKNVLMPSGLELEINQIKNNWEF